MLVVWVVWMLVKLFLRVRQLFGCIFSWLVVCRNGLGCGLLLLILQWVIRVCSWFSKLMCFRCFGVVWWLVEVVMAVVILCVFSVFIILKILGLIGIVLVMCVLRIVYIWVLQVLKGKFLFSVFSMILWYWVLGILIWEWCRVLVIL